MSNRRAVEFRNRFHKTSAVVDRIAQSMPADVHLDRQLIDVLVRRCQVLIGRVPLLGVPAVAGQLRALIEKTPRPRTVLGEALVEHLVLQLAQRLSPGLEGSNSRAAGEKDRSEEGRRADWRPGEVLDALMNAASRVQPGAWHGSADAARLAELGLRGHRAVDKAAVFIDARFADPHLRLAQVAAHVRLSPSHLDRLLLKYVGIGFGGHLRRSRIGHAMKLLAHGDLSIKEIAAAVGYDRVSTFDRNFKQVCGCSPGAWRSRHEREPGSLERPRTSRIEHEKQE